MGILQPVTEAHLGNRRKSSNIQKNLRSTIRCRYTFAVAKVPAQGFITSFTASRNLDTRSMISFTAFCSRLSSNLFLNPSVVLLNSQSPGGPRTRSFIVSVYHGRFVASSPWPRSLHDRAMSPLALLPQKIEWPSIPKTCALHASRPSFVESSPPHKYGEVQSSLSQMPTTAVQSRTSRSQTCFPQNLFLVVFSLLFISEQEPSRKE